IREMGEKDAGRRPIFESLQNWPAAGTPPTANECPALGFNFAPELMSPHGRSPYRNREWLIPVAPDPACDKMRAPSALGAQTVRRALALPPSAKTAIGRLDEGSRVAAEPHRLLVCRSQES